MTARNRRQIAGWAFAACASLEAANAALDVIDRAHPALADELREVRGWCSRVALSIGVECEPCDELPEGNPWTALHAHLAHVAEHVRISRAAEPSRLIELAQRAAEHAQRVAQRGADHAAA